MADEKGPPPHPNLRPIKPGEVRNPRGINGSTRLAELRQYLDAHAEPTSRLSRRENVWLALYATAIDRRRRDHVAAAKLLTAYDVGQPRQAIEVSQDSDSELQGSNPLLGLLEDRIRANDLGEKPPKPRRPSGRK